MKEWRILMIAGLLVFTTPAVLPFTPARAADDKKGAACLVSCQTKLKRAGLWTSYPRGYCRSQCDYFVGAPPDVKR
jgi:hypothetical protein